MKSFKKRIYILCIVLVCSFYSLSFAQTFGDKDYFLIDSLNITELSESDQSILNEALNKYHNAKHDSLRIDALEMITENLMDDAWVRYNLIVKGLVEKNLLLSPPNYFKKRLLKSLAATINNIGVDCEQNGNLVDAILYFHKSLKIQEHLNELDAVATTLNKATIPLDTEMVKHMV